MGEASLAERVARLEAIEAIKALKARAAHLADIGDAQAYADLYAEDGIFIGAFQRHEGRERIRTGIRFWPFSRHYVLNPEIAVEGSTATGSWYFLMPLVATTGEAAWAAGRYEDRYVRMGTEWKFASVHLVEFYRQDRGMWQDVINKRPAAAVPSP